MPVKTVGLTGGIGSGKTFITSIFNLMGVLIYNSDIHAKRLMTENDNLIHEIKDLLGKKAYDDQGNLDRAYVSKIIFKQPEKLIKLNNLVHPAVRKDFQNFVKTLSSNETPYVINEAALFVENGTYKDFDALISVVAPEALRIKRILSRDDTDLKSIRERMEAQSTDKAKMDVSDFVIYNDACDNLFAQITEIHFELLTFVKK